MDNIPQDHTWQNELLLKHPWQNGPTELICYAIDHLYRKADFDKRIAFLLLDIGVETLLKTYLTLPEKVTGTTVKYHDRKNAAEGNFHDLVEGVVKSAGNKISDNDMYHVEFYHDIRNKLYHQGNGITIPVDKAHKYAELAVNLLNILLAVDLSSYLNKPALQEERKRKFIERNKQIINRLSEIKDRVKRSKDNLLPIIEVIAPSLTLHSSKNKFDNILDKHSTEDAYHYDEETQELFSYKVIPMDDRINTYSDIRRLFTSLLSNCNLSDRLMECKLFTLAHNPIDGIPITMSIEVIFESEQFPPIDYEDILLNVVRYGLPTEGKDWYQSISDANLFMSRVRDVDLNDDDFPMTIKEADDIIVQLDNTIQDIKTWLIKHEGN